MFKDKVAILFVIMAFVAGMCGAFFYPLSSKFIIESLGATPFMLTGYLVTTVCGAVVVSQVMAYHSDKGWKRKTVLTISLASYFITVASFTVIDNYLHAVLIALVFGSMSGAIFGQMFALGREYAENHMDDGTNFMAVMRAGIAIAWVFGPPIAFTLQANWGFTAAFAIAAVATLVMILFTLFVLPSEEALRQPKTHSVIDADKTVTNESAERKADHTASDAKKGLPNDKPTSAPPKSMATGKGALFAFSTAIVLMFAANNLYITSMPLYLSQELMADDRWAGMLFGMAALCELPVMFAAGKLSKRFGTLNLLCVAMISACLFYTSVMFATTLPQLLAAQLFNGVFIGICATLGMVAMQDMMLDRLGTASTLFSNLLQVSMLVSSLSVGVVAELYNYYSTLYVSLGASAIALVMLFGFVIRDRQQAAVAHLAA
uniref:sugar efflux transporter n=1 Tax=Thaumasiovibrio occultus TaxID=1891184 RepID=UPI000B34AE85|nr:sugar efflux transporter [Thaumasiovibrio occultus]